MDTRVRGPPLRSYPPTKFAKFARFENAFKNRRLEVEKLLSGDLRYSKFDTAREDAGLTCADCVYWEAFVEGLGGNYGFCRRHAPPAVTVAKAAEYEARWPLTEESEWCGEYRPHSPEVTSR